MTSASAAASTSATASGRTGLGEELAERPPDPAGAAGHDDGASGEVEVDAHARSRIRTTPFDPSTSTRSPVLIADVAPTAPTTAGMPRSRDDDHRVAQLAAHLGDDGDGADEQRHPSRIGDRGDQHLARLGRVVGVGVHHDAGPPGRDTRAAGGAGDLVPVAGVAESASDLSGHSSTGGTSPAIANNGSWYRSRSALAACRAWTRSRSTSPPRAAARNSSNVRK